MTEISSTVTQSNSERNKQARNMIKDISRQFNKISHLKGLGHDW